MIYTVLWIQKIYTGKRKRGESLHLYGESHESNGEPPPMDINTDKKCFQSKENKMSTLHSNTHVLKRYKICTYALLCRQPRTGYTHKKKWKNTSPFFLTCLLILAETCSQWPDWCTRSQQCGLNSAKCSTFQLRYKVIVQGNKEVKLYIPNHTEKHLKHQYKLMIAALLHVIYKQGRKRRNASLHQPCTCFLNQFFHRILKILFNSGLLLHDNMEDLRQGVLLGLMHAQYILLLTVRGNKSHIWGKLPHLLLWLMTEWWHGWVWDGKRHKKIFFLTKLNSFRYRNAYAGCVSQYANNKPQQDTSLILQGSDC